LPADGPSIVGFAKVRVNVKLVPSFVPVIESSVIAGPAAPGIADEPCEALRLPAFAPGRHASANARKSPQFLNRFGRIGFASQ
jgi:hypothetical protein